MEASPKLRPKTGAFAGGRLLAMQPDRIVCALALRGNGTAYEVLYERYHGSVYGFAYHLLGRGATAEDAQDIAQETFSTAFSKLGDRREEGSFKSWLFTIARNRTFDHLRVRRLQPADVTELAIAGAADTERDAESNAQMTWLVSAMNELPPRQREALVMKELGGMPLAEIAAAMETTSSGVKQLLNRARNSLGEAAEDSGFSRRRLRGDLNSVVPALPAVAGGGVLATLGIGGAAAGGVATAGGLSAGSKAAAVLLTVAAIGGGTAGVRQVASSDGNEAGARASESGGGGSGGRDSAPAALSPPANSDDDGSSGDRGERRGSSSDREASDGDGDSQRSPGRRRSESGSSEDENAGSGDRGESEADDDSRDASDDSGDDSTESESGSGESAGESEHGDGAPDTEDPGHDAEQSRELPETEKEAEPPHPGD